MIHINTFIRSEIIAAYTAADDDVPGGTPVGRQGNAVLLQDGVVVHVVSRPSIEGSILDVIPDAAASPEIDLSDYF